MKMRKTNRGLVHVYTGNGKGKTTAALGLALRAISYRKRVLIVQFIKGPWRSGELNIVEKLKPYLTIHAMGEGFVRILGDKKPIAIHKRAAMGAFTFARTAMLSKKFDVIILDEILVAIMERLLPASIVAGLITKKPSKVELVLTGRGASATIIKLADYVSEIKEVKHPFKKGILARETIDY